jgi:hypothetical protein
MAALALAVGCLVGVAPTACRAGEKSDAPHDGKVYIISNVHSGKRLAIEKGSRDAGGKLVQDDAARTHVTWRLEKVGDGSFRVVNTSSGLVLDVPGQSDEAGLQLQQWEANAGDNQAWEFIRVGDAYAIRCKQSKLVVDVSQASKDDGAAVGQFPLKEKHEQNQLWVLTEVKK